MLNAFYQPLESTNLDGLPMHWESGDVIGQSFPLPLCLLFTPNLIALSACSVHQQRMSSLFMIAGLGLAEN